MFAYVLFAFSTPSFFSIADAARQEQLFQAWNLAKAETRSLVVEFTLQGGLFHFPEETSRCVLKLRREVDGRVLAKSVIKPAREGMAFQVGQLVGDVAYLINPVEKTALRFNLAGQNKPAVLGRYYNPFLVLLDRELIREQYVLRVSKQDEWYTYLSLTPKRSPKRAGFLNFSDGSFGSGIIALCNKDSESIPKNMPKAAVWTDGVVRYRCDVQRWQRNAPEPPPLSEFQAPEDMPGWRVLETDSQATRKLPSKK